MEALQQLLKQLPRDIVPLASARALNKTGVLAKSVAVKTVATKIGITQKEVRPFIGLQKAHRLCLDAVLFVAKAKRLPLIKIDPKAKQSATGVTYRGPGGVRRIGAVTGEIARVTGVGQMLRLSNRTG